MKMTKLKKIKKFKQREAKSKIDAGWKGCTHTYTHTHILPNTSHASSSSIVDVG